MKILIADDHPVVRQGLRLMLEAQADISRVAEAGSAAEALERLRGESWDALVLDLNLPDRSGFEVLHDVRARWPQLPVLILSIHPEHIMGARLLKAGAAGYLNKDSAPAELLNAVRSVAAGHRYVSPALAQILAEQLRTNGAGAPHERLSEREFQVFRLLASGKPVGEVAELLHLSANTVSTYRARILEKMELANNAELMRYAVENGLV